MKFTVKKRKKYRLTLSFVATWLFFVSSLMFFGTKLFLHTINNRSAS